MGLTHLLHFEFGEAGGGLPGSEGEVGVGPVTGPVPWRSDLQMPPGERVSLEKFVLMVNVNDVRTDLEQEVVVLTIHKGEME